MTNLNLVKVFECEGNISLDKEYLTNLSDGKFKVREVIALLTEEAIDKLVQVNNNTFNFSLYDSYRENGEEEKEYEYFQANAKCLSKYTYGFKTFTSITEANEYVKDME